MFHYLNLHQNNYPFSKNKSQIGFYFTAPTYILPSAKKQEKRRLLSKASNHPTVSIFPKPLTDQAVRRMLNKYTTLAAIDMHITPHLFRHTFATSLLEADVDIRYIQQMLGHSSINITEIYTHVATNKQKNILTTKHPRNNFNF